MSRKTRLIMIVLATMIMVLITSSVFVFKRRGVPFVTKREQWTIGIYTGNSPLELSNTRVLRNPVLTAEDVTDIPAKFVADPFLFQEDSTWHLFFEAYNWNTEQGDLAVATSRNTKSWQYQQVIIDEPFHLSYPYVFKWDGDYYLIPESFEAESVRLYRATNFPYEWDFVTTLVDNIALVDPSIVRYEDVWWLFAADANNKHDTLRLYYSDALTSGWIEHPSSPVVEGDNHKARPSGRVLVYEDTVFRYTMDINPPVGTHQVWAYQITELSKTDYAEVLVGDEPLVQADGSGWNAQAMHHVDAHQIDTNNWIAAVDGFGKYLIYGWQY